MIHRRRSGASAALPPALLLALALVAPATAQLENGTCVIEIPSTGDVALTGSFVWTGTVDGPDGSSVNTKQSIAIKASPGAAKGVVSGVIPVAFPKDVPCTFPNAASNKGDPGFAALSAALARAKVGTANTPDYKLNVTQFSGSLVTGNPDSDTGNFQSVDYSMDSLTLDFDLSPPGLKPGAQKTCKVAASFADGGDMTLSAQWRAGKLEGSFEQDGMDLGADAKITKTSPCKITVRSGAISISCSSFAISYTYAFEDGDTTLNGKLQLKGGTISGSAPLTSAKAYYPSDDGFAPGGGGSLNSAGDSKRASGR